MILLIGASSFIGVYTADALRQAGFEILGTGRSKRFEDYYARRGIGYVGLDLTDPNAFDMMPKEGVEAVILLAALLPANSPVDLRYVESAEEYFAVNTVGTIRVLEYCRKNNIGRVVSTTTYSEIFSSWGSDIPLTEDTPIGYPPTGDHTAYAVSKRAAAEMMEYYNRQHGMRNVVFRLPPVYGAGPHGSLFVNGKRVKSGLEIFMERARRGEDIEVYGNGEIRRDVVYVKDVADAFVKVLKSEDARGLYNLSSGRGVTLRSQAEAAARAFAGERGVSKIVLRPGTPNHAVSCILDITKARESFGYDPKYADFSKLMEDYRMEEDRGIYGGLFL